MNDRKKNNPEYCKLEIDNRNNFKKIVDFIKNNKYNHIFLIIFIGIIIFFYILINNLNPLNLINVNYSLLFLFILIYLVLLNYLIKINNLNFKILKFILIIIFIISICYFLNYIYFIMKNYLSSEFINIIFLIVVILLLLKFHKKIFHLFNNIYINVISILNKLKPYIYNIYSNNYISFKLLSITSLLIFIILIPKIYNYINSSINGSTTLLKNPIYLNKEYTINMNKFINLTNPNYHYSISFWFWINPQPLNTSYTYNKYTNIFDYGNTPSIEVNPLKNKFRIKYKKNINNNEIIYENKIISYQKWNNVFINFDGGNIDIFLNGKLVASKSNIISKIEYKNLVLGENKGIHGAISNVVYYKKNMDLNTIVNNYNYFKNYIYPYF